MRDPRTDPVKGDVLRKTRWNGKILERRVGQLRGRDHRRKVPVVRFFEWHIDEDRCKHCGADLANWRAWAKTATVIKRAEE